MLTMARVNLLRRQHSNHPLQGVQYEAPVPWIQSKGLASKILSKIARQLPVDWHQRYGYRPVLFETFVESQRHRGTCYKAANWIHVGQTTGRGKKSTVHHQIIPIKDIWLYPLRKDFASVLCR